jgi:hypothetical protein
MADAPEGWYPDPADPSEEIYWLGTSWSSARRSVHQATQSEGGSVPPPPPVPPAAPVDPVVAAPVAPAVGVTGQGAVAATTVLDPAPPPTAMRKNKFGLWAMIVGIVAVVTAIIPGLSFVTWIPAAGAVVLGIFGLRQTNAPRGQSLSGIILGPVAFLIAVVVSVSFIGTLGAHSTSANAPIKAAAVPSSEPSKTSPSPTETAAPPTSPYGTYPASEAAFVKTVTDAEAAYQAASTDLERSQVIATRDAALCAATSGNHVDGWVGTIHDIGANGDGYAWVNVEIEPTTVVQTWNNDFSDAGSNTLIHPEAPFFQTLVPMKVGQKITFSGDFLSSSKSCLDQENLTQTFYALDPNFIFRFSNVAAQ